MSKLEKLWFRGLIGAFGGLWLSHMVFTALNIACGSVAQGMAHLACAGGCLGAMWICSRTLRKAGDMDDDGG